jgi:hypothetical protein
MVIHDHHASKKNRTSVQASQFSCWWVTSASGRWVTLEKRRSSGEITENNIVYRALYSTQAVCPKTSTTFAPETPQAYSMLPSMSSFTTLPATWVLANRGIQAPRLQGIARLR